MGSSKKATVGYSYYMGLHMGLCHGPVDALLAIEAGGRIAWTGSQTSSGTITVNAPELWGGEEREGGVAAVVDVMMGEPAQQANAYLASQQGADQPAYRGLFGVVVRGPSSPSGISAGTEEVNVGGAVIVTPITRPSGLVAANNPYLKPWAFRVRRILQGWLGGTAWYSAKASIDLGGGLLAMNPAHIVYECLTNTEWGLGYPSGQLDLATFTAAADTFHAEGLGLCMAWSQQDSLLGFLQLVMDHAGAVLVQDRTTGLFRLRAVRGDYTLASLPLFGSESGNVLEVSRIERSTYTEAVNEITVAYVDAATGKDGSVTVQQLAAIQAQGAVVPETRQYPGIPTAELALRTAMRDLRAATSGLARVTMTVNRAGYSILPGDVLRFQWLPAGIADMALRVASVDYGSLTDGAVTIECIEDVFSLPATSYVNPQPGGSGAITTPQASQGALAIEAPYLSLVRQVGDSAAQGTPVDAGYVIAMAPRPAGSPINCALEARIGSGEWSQAGTSDWTPTMLLAAEISPTATAITVSSISLGTSVVVGDLVLLGSGTSHEIAQVSAFDATAGTMTLRRGCLDTIPRRWFGGTRLYVFSRIAGNIETQYVAPEVVGVRFRTVASTGMLDAVLAPSVTVTMDQRQARPYPPGNLTVNGARFPSIIAGELVLSWSHRDRLGQSDLVLDQLSGNTGPEAGTTYTLRLYGETGTLLRTVTGLTGTSYTWSTEAADSALPGGRLNITLRFELEAVRDGLTSYMRYDLSLTRAGVADPGTVVPGSSPEILGEVPTGAQTGVVTTAQLTAAGISGSPVWEVVPGSTAGATISQSGLLTLNFPTAGTATVDVRLTDYPSMTNAVRRYVIRVEAGAAPTPAVSGNLLGGYVGAPYFLNAIGGEGFTFTRPPNGSAWYSNASTGMPPNMTWASCYACGMPTAAGTYSWATRFNPSGTFDYVDVSGSVTILAAPPCTVLNMADREIGPGSVRFVAGSAPMLTVEGVTGLSTDSGYVRALNGHASGKRYWEVEVDALPSSGTYAAEIGAGVDRSRYGLVTYDANGEYAGAVDYPNSGVGSDRFASIYGYGMRRFEGQASFGGATIGGRDYAVPAPSVVAGDVLRFAHDADTGRLWIGIAGRGWIGGGNPETNTAPTLSGLVAEAGARFSEWKPWVFAKGAGTRLTCNFGSQAWAGGGPPTGFTTIAFQQVPEFSRMVLDSDTMDTRGVPGSERGVFVLSRNGAGGIIYSPERYAVGVMAREGLGSGGELPTIRGGVPKSTGKWQVEMGGYSFPAYACIGLAPFDWVQSVGGGPGYTSDSFGVFPRDPAYTATGEIRNGGTVVATPASGYATWTLAVDLDASPKTVRVLRNNVLVGTYNLPNTGKPWVPVLGYAGAGYATVRFDSLRYPQAGFNDWLA